MAAGLAANAWMAAGRGPRGRRRLRLSRGRRRQLEFGLDVDSSCLRLCQGKIAQEQFRVSSFKSKINHKGHEGMFRHALTRIKPRRRGDTEKSQEDCNRLRTND